MLVSGNLSNVQADMNCYVLLYSISYSQGLLRELPYAFYFPERSLAYLSMLRDKNVFLILFIPEVIDNAILTYHFTELYRFTTEDAEDAKNRFCQICPVPGSSIPLIDLIYEGEEVKKLLSHLSDRVKTIEILNFSPSTKIEKLGDQFNIPVQEKPEKLALKLGSKSGNKSVLAESGIPTPQGVYTVAKSEEQLTQNALSLIRQKPDIEKLILKLDDGRWGDALGNVVLDKERFLESKNIEDSIEKSLQPWNNLVSEIKEGGAVVEEYMKGVISSPSSQGFIHQDGSVTIVSTQEQILVKDQYLGCCAPPQTSLLPKICESVQKAGRTLFSKGIRGSFGLDFINFEDGRLLVAEINIRKLGTSHAVAYVESVLNTRISSDGIIRNKKQEIVHYIHRRFFEPPTLKGIELGDVFSILKERGLTYNHDSQSGVILHILSAVKTCGYVELTSISDSKDSAANIDQAVRDALAEFRFSIKEG